MKRCLILVVSVLMVCWVPAVQAASEDWGLNCFRLIDQFGVPFVDVLTLRLVRPNPPEWNLDAQAALRGLSAYTLRGGGDVRTDLDESLYVFNLILRNTSGFFGGQPFVTMRGMFGGPYFVEGRGLPGVPAFVSHGSSIANAPCPDDTGDEDLSVASEGSGHLLGTTAP